CGGRADYRTLLEGTFIADGAPPAFAKGSAFAPERANGGEDGGPSRREDWSGRWESNPRHTAWEAVVLPLNYARARPEHSERPVGGARSAVTRADDAPLRLM